MDILFDRYSLILNGSRKFIRSGAIHYFRLPHQDLWWDRLQKLKMSGYNTIDIYFNWDFHSHAPGEYSFSGIKDIKRLLDMVESLGLYFIARPGPYINAETTRGGLPGWLLTEPDVILRNRIDGDYHYSPRYMAFVKEWFDKLLPFLKDRENLMMIQIENEYSTLEMEPDYIEELIALVRSHGINVPTMHNDFYAAGLYADIVDLYAVDNYSVTMFDLNWRSFPDLFSVIDHLELDIRQFCADRPLIVAELQAGWFAGWKGIPYETIHKSLGRDHIGMVTRSFIGQGGTVFNHYKAVGGTNWGDIGATDAYTSYDFSAPISESGLPTERMYEAKRINLLLEHFDLTKTERREPEKIGVRHSNSLYLVREDLNHPGAFWIFTRNLTAEPLQLEVEQGVVTETLPYHAHIVPRHLPLKNGWILESINVEPLVQTGSTLILPGSKRVTVRFKLPDKVNSADVQSDNRIKWVRLEKNSLHELQLNRPLLNNELASISVGNYHIHFLGEDLADRIWPMGNGEYLIGLDIVKSKDEMALWKRRKCWKLQRNGSIESLDIDPVQSIEFPLLKSWHLTPGDTPLDRDESFKLVSSKGSDMDSNCFYEGAVWYRYTFTGKAETLSIHAEHIWAVYLNQEPLIQSHTFHVHPDKGGPEDLVLIKIPQELLKTGEENEILIFVESLGHHKGFYDDAREPQGLLTLKLDNREIQNECQIRKAALSTIDYARHNSIRDMADSERTSFPIVYASIEFDLSLPEKAMMPVGLQINLDIERVNITLNGMLLGKYWRACKNQTIFYLPKGILNPNGLNHLELTLMNFFPPLTVENSFPKAYGEVKLISYLEISKSSKLFAEMVDINS